MLKRAPVLLVALGVSSSSLGVACVPLPGAGAQHLLAMRALPPLPPPATPAEWSALAGGARRAAACEGCAVVAEARLQGSALTGQARPSFDVEAGHCYRIGAAWRADVDLLLTVVRPVPIGSASTPTGALRPHEGVLPPVCAERDGRIEVGGGYVAPGGALAPDGVEVMLVVTRSAETEGARAERHEREEAPEAASREHVARQARERREERCRSTERACYVAGEQGCFDDYRACLGE